MKPEIIGLIVMIGALLIAFGVIIVCYVNIMIIDARLFFISFKFEKHPKILAILKNTLNDLCEAQGIKVFDKSIEEINKNKKEGDDAIGKYIYTLDVEHQKKIDTTLSNIRQLETKYKMSYKELCASINKPIDWDYDEYSLPRILLAKENLMKYGYTSYFTTFLHELGHHFAVKKFGNDHTEQDADDFALEIVKTSLPAYFQLIFFHSFTYEKNPRPKIPAKEMLKAYREFGKYLWNEKKNNFKLKIWHKNL